MRSPYGCTPSFGLHRSTGRRGHNHAVVVGAWLPYHLQPTSAEVVFFGGLMSEGMTILALQPAQSVFWVLMALRCGGPRKIGLSL